MIKTLGIAVLNRGDFLHRCVLSVDHPIENLVIINNSNGKNQVVNSVCASLEARNFQNAALFENVKIETNKNLGCGPSWNRIMKGYPGPWLIAGNDIAFLPGALSLFDDVYERHPAADLIFGDGYNVFMMTPSGVEKIGYFDENFFPAYYEDVDHHYRASLAKATILGVDGFRRIHGDATSPDDYSQGSNTVRSDPLIRQKNGTTMNNNYQYFVRKWGGTPEGPKFPTPYNKDVPVTFWELDPELRKKNDLW